MTNPTNGQDPRSDGGLGDELGRELHQRVEQLHGAPLTLGEVKGRAWSIRRTRRLATATGVAAAVAIIVPVAVFAGNGLDRADGPGPATTSPSATQSPTQPPNQTPTGATEAPNGQAYELSGDFPEGAPPALPYLDGTALMRPDGTSVALPRRHYQFVTLGDEAYGVYSDAGGPMMLERYSMDPSGDIPGRLSLGEIVGSVVMSAQGTSIAWGTPDGTIETAWAGGQVQLARDLGRNPSPVAIQGNGDCHEDAGGCRVFFNHERFGQAPEAADSHGIVDEFAPGAIKVNDVSATGLIAVMKSASDTGSCNGVFDEEARKYLWNTCEFSFLDFSPEGDHLLATGAYRDGFGLTFVTVLDAASGDPLVRFEINQGAIVQTAWEDEEHLLAVTYDEVDGWRILRLGLDGTREVVASPGQQTSQDERTLFLQGKP